MSKMSRKTFLAAFCPLLIFIGYNIIPTFAILPYTVVTTTVTTLEVDGETMTVTLYRYDTYQYYQHYVSFEGQVEWNGIPFLNITTDKYPYERITNPIGETKLPAFQTSGSTYGTATLPSLNIQVRRIHILNTTIPTTMTLTNQAQ